MIHPRSKWKNIQAKLRALLVNMDRNIGDIVTLSMEYLWSVPTPQAAPVDTIALLQLSSSMQRKIVFCMVTHKSEIGPSLVNECIRRYKSCLVDIDSWCLFMMGSGGGSSVELEGGWYPSLLPIRIVQECGKKDIKLEKKPELKDGKDCIRNNGLVQSGKRKMEEIQKEPKRLCSEKKDKVCITIEMEKEAAGMRKVLEGLSVHEVVSDSKSEVQEAAKLLHEVIKDRVENAVVCLPELVEKLGLVKLPDEILLVWTRWMVSQQLTFGQSLLFARHCVFPKFVVLNAPASRTLLSTITCMNEQYPGVIARGVCLPLFEEQPEDFVLGTHQGELISRIIKLKLQTQDDAAICRAIVHWCQKKCDRLNDPTIAILQALLNTKVAIEEDTMASIVMCLVTASNVAATQKSAKFATLLFALVSKYPIQCMLHKMDLKNIADRCTSFMMNAVRRGIGKLE